MCAHTLVNCRPTTSNTHCLSVVCERLHRLCYTAHLLTLIIHTTESSTRLGAGEVDAATGPLPVSALESRERIQQRQREPTRRRIRIRIDTNHRHKQEEPKMYKMTAANAAPMLFPRLAVFDSFSFCEPRTMKQIPKPSGNR